MYIRTVNVKNKRGVTHTYVQLCHNYRDPETKASKTRVVYSFGRLDHLDIEAMRRLVSSASRFLPAEAGAIDGSNGRDVRVRRVRDLGDLWLLDCLWRRLGIRTVFQRLLAGYDYSPKLERIIFSLVAGKICASRPPSSWEQWINNDVFIRDLEQVTREELRSSVEFLLEAEESICRAVFAAMNVEADAAFLAFHDVIEQDIVTYASEATAVTSTRAVAITTKGFPIGYWSWHQNSSRPTLLPEVLAELKSTQIDNVVLLQSEGRATEYPLSTLPAIKGRKVSDMNNKVAQEKLRGGGKFRCLAPGLEFRPAENPSTRDRQAVIVRDSALAKSERAERNAIIAELEQKVNALESQSSTQRERAALALERHEVYGTYLRRTKRGYLRLDRGKVAAAERLEGRFLVDFPAAVDAADAAQSFIQMIAVEKALRRLQPLRTLCTPYFLTAADTERIEAIASWLALIVWHEMSTKTGRPAEAVLQAVDSIKIVQYDSPGVVEQITTISQAQKRLFAQLEVQIPELH